MPRKCSPKVKGYYYGTEAAVPEFYAPLANPQAQAAPAPQSGGQLQGQSQGTSAGEAMAQNMTKKAMNEGLDKFFEKDKEGKTKSVEALKKYATNIKDAEGFKDTAKAIFGFKDGMYAVPPMGYADGIGPVKPLHEQQKDSEYFEAEEVGEDQVAKLGAQLAEDLAVDAAATAASAIPIVGPVISFGIKGGHMANKKARAQGKADQKKMEAEAKSTSADIAADSAKPQDAVASVDVMDDSKVAAPLASVDEVLGKDEDILAEASQGFADGKKSIDDFMKEYREKMNAPTEASEKLRQQLRGQNTEATDKVRKKLFEGYADGKENISPEEFQKRFIEERIIEPAKQYVEDRPMLSAPLAAIAAGRAFEKGEMKLGKFKGGKFEGGRDRLAYSHPKYGDFEINPESERVSYKKVFRF